MAFDTLRTFFVRSTREDTARTPPAASRSECMQRLQVGSFGIGAMLLLVGLANIIMDGVQESQATAVPAAAPTVAITEIPEPVRDPLADAGVVPDLPAEPEAGGAAGEPAGALPSAAPATGNGATPSPP